MNIEPWHWLVLGALLLICELFTFTFALLCFGAAALLLALISWLLPLPLTFQVILWLVLSGIALFVWFKFAKPLAKDRTKAGLGGSVVVGEIGMVIQTPVNGGQGLIRFSVPILGADEWSFRSEDEFAIGDRAKIVDILGNELVVVKI